MQIVIHSLDFSLTDALRKHCEQRCRYALTAYREHVQRVVLRLSSGSRTEKCCQVQVVIGGLADVVVEDIESNLYAAIGRASARAGRTVRRRLARRRDRARLSGLHDSTAITEQPDTI